MRIALLTPGFSRHAGHWAIPALEVYATRLAQSCHVHVFSLRYPEAGTSAWAGIQHTAIGGGERMGAASGNVIWQAAQAIRRAHRQTPFDLIHAFWADEAGFTAALTARWLRLPAIVSCAGGELVWFGDIHYGTQGSLFRRWLVRAALRQATLVTAGSRYQLALARAQGVAAERLYLAPLGVDCAHFRPASLPPDHSPTLIQAASLTPIKGQPLLLETLRQVRQQLPTARLKLVGEGPLRPQLQRQASQSGLADAIAWQGRVTFAQMPTHYQQAHLHLQTSLHEAQGMSVLEALACGLPALGTPVGVLPEVAAAPPQTDASALAAQAIALLTDPAAHQSASAQARLLAQTTYDLPITMQNFHTLYQRALNQ